MAADFTNFSNFGQAFSSKSRFTTSGLIGLGFLVFGLGVFAMLPPRIPDEAFPPLYVAVGEFLINWSLLESVIVQTSAAIYHAAGGKHQDPVLPFGYTKNKKFIRLCAKKIAALAPYKEGLEKVLSNATPLAKARDGIIHGALSEFDPATATYVFVRLDPNNKESIHYENRLKVRCVDLAKATEACQRTTVWGQEALTALLDAFPD